MIRRAELKDAGRIAYLMLRWDAELPTHIHALRGNAKYAEQSAHIVVTNPRYHAMAYELDGEIIAGYVLSVGAEILSPDIVASMFMWYVLPAYRDKFIGVRLLFHAMEYAKSLNAKRIDVFPWADSASVDRLLTRPAFGFSHLANIYTRFL